MKKKHWVIVISGLMLAAGVYMKVRGIRNNNPGNLKRNGVPWTGLSPVQTDATFYQFKSVEYGLRAMAKLLMNYQSIHGLDTIKDIINRWAPPVENETSNYVAFVAKKMNVKPGDRISVRYFLKPLMKAIITFENGVNPYSDATIDKAIAMV